MESGGPEGRLESPAIWNLTSGLELDVQVFLTQNNLTLDEPFGDYENQGSSQSYGIECVHRSLYT